MSRSAHKRIGICLALFIVMIIAAPLRAAHGAEIDTPMVDTVAVTDIEIDDYKDVISVDETLELAVTVLPQDATEQTISYASSSEKILTINSKGRVKGIAPGTAAVTLAAGGLTKRISIRVRVATESIGIDSNYLVLKTGAAHKVTAKAVPNGASQELSYKSLNPKVAEVTKAGVITARAPGSASILVSNDETSAAITVIVNRGTATAESAGRVDTPDDPTGGADAEQTAAEYAALVARIGDSGTVAVSAADYPVLTAEIL
ncbi:MAG: Ig-like domain-containing protein, partial [Clostridiales Family XIII bacterium]|nr:Ig-like domain-containing protein [Clostridiales Family XIII bacterium]